MWSDNLRGIEWTNIPATAAALWGATTTAPRQLVSHGVNVVYRVAHANGTMFLRISSPGHDRRSSLNLLLELQEFLSENDVHVCRPIRSVNDQLCETIGLSGVDYFVCAIQGVHGECATSAMPKQIFHRWGRSLANLHKKMSEFEQPYSLSFKKQDYWREKMRAYLIKEGDSQLCEAFAQATEILLQVDHECLIHGDHQSRNVVMYQSQPHFIDFDEVGQGWRARDAAFPFMEWGRDRGIHSKFDAFVTGYANEISVGINFRREVLCAGAMEKIGIYLSCKNEWTREVSPSGGSVEEWLNQLYANALSPLIEAETLL